MFYLVMLSSNAICDAFGVRDEHERGMVRMLVNSLLWTSACVGVVVAVWMVVG